MRHEPRFDPEPIRLDLTPFLDCVLLLVLFFLMVASTGSDRVEVMYLPRVSAESVDEDRPCGKIVRPVVNLLGDGTVWIKGRCYYDPADTSGTTRLETHLRKAVRFMPKRPLDRERPVAIDNPLLPDNPVLIRADRSCPTEVVESVFGIFRSEGVHIWKVELAAEYGEPHPWPPLLNWWK